MVPLRISLLNRYSVKNPKKEVDDSLDLLLTVVKGHFLACAYKVLGTTALNSRVAFTKPLLINRGSTLLQ